MDEKQQDLLRAMAKSLPTGSTMCLHDVAIGPPLPGHRATIVILADKGAVPNGVNLSLAAAQKLHEAIHSDAMVVSNTRPTTE